ncbi:MAG TPA: hypothetical protein VNL71_23950, partial [Chloroflexota bacterium]|nr:hypothetical protein [Chloroflexota bacterium]
ESNALIQTMSAYGVKQSQMAGQAKMYQDAITAMVNLGIVQPAEVPASVTTFSTPAARNRIPFDLASGMFAASTYTTRSPQQSSQDEAAFMDAIAHPQLPARQTAAMLHVTDLLGQQGLSTLGTDPKKYFTELENAVKLNPGLDLPKLFGQVNASDFVSGLLGPGGQNLGRTMNVIGATSQQGTTAASFAAYEKSPAAQFDNSVAAFKTAEQQFAEAATPLATALVQFATSGVKELESFLAGPGGKGGAGESTAAVLQFYGNFFNPSSPDFLNAQKSGADAAKQRQAFHDAQVTANQGLNAPLSANGMMMVAAAPGSPQYAANQGHPYAPRLYEEYGNAVQKAAFGPHVAPGTDTLHPDLSAPGRTYGGRSPTSHAPRDQMYFGGGTGAGRWEHTTPVYAPADQHAMQLAAIERASQAQQASAALAAEQAMVNQKYGPGALTGGAAGSAPMAVTAAAERVATALNTFQGKNTVESALGSYVQAVNDSPLLTALKKSSDIASETQKVARYERGMAGGPDQT